MIGTRKTMKLENDNQNNKGVIISSFRLADFINVLLTYALNKSFPSLSFLSPKPINGQ